MKLLLPLAFMFFISCKQAKSNYQSQEDSSIVMFKRDTLMKFIQNVYRDAFIEGSNSAVYAHNHQIAVTDDYVITHLFKDSSEYVKLIVITKEK